MRIFASLRAALARLAGQRAGEQRHPVLCSWCRMYRSGQEPNVTGWSTVANSSGICPECKLRVLAEDANSRGAGRADRALTDRERQVVIEELQADRARVAAMARRILADARAIGDHTRLAIDAELAGNLPLADCHHRLALRANHHATGLYEQRAVLVETMRQTERDLMDAWQPDRSREPRPTRAGDKEVDRDS